MDGEELERGRTVMANKEDANQYRLLQIKKILALFEGANGRPARTSEELDQWLGSPEGRRATAYDRDSRGKIVP